MVKAKKPNATPADLAKVEHRIGKDFILAGDATFTIVSPPLGKGAKLDPAGRTHRTYRVEYSEPNNGYPEAFFVKTLTGPDNETHYSYVGILDPKTGEVRTTAKSKHWEGTTRLTLLRRVLYRVWRAEVGEIRKHGYDVLHSGKCGRCGRKLTVPSSVESGIGPECAKHLRAW